MKQKLIIAFGILMTVMMTACFNHHGSTIITNSDDSYIEINYDGQVRFNEEETAIESISNGGYLRFRKNNKKMIVEQHQGSLTYVIDDNGTRLSPNDPDGKRFIEDAVKDMLAMGFDAERRMQRLYKKGGAPAILEEVGNLRDDQLKSAYLTYLVDTDDSLSLGEMKEIVRKTGLIGSDFEKSNLLSRIGGSYLKDSSITAVYLDAIKSVGSDFDKSNIIRNIAKQKLNESQTDQLIEAINSIGSDFEKQNCLQELIRTQDISTENYARLLDAIEKVGSDFEKQALLDELLDQKKTPAGQFSKLIQTIENIGSDFDKAKLFKKLGSANVEGDENWVNLIDAASKVGSDYDKSNLLVELSKTMPATETVKTAYRNAAKSIGSDADYARAIRSIN